MATLAPPRPSTTGRAPAAIPAARRPRLRTRALVPGIPAAVTLALGLWGITRRHSMWRDEAATWQVTHRSLGGIWHLLDEVDLVHGLYYVITHGLFALFGDSLYTLRVPSALAMAAAAALTASLGARLAGPWAGLSAGLAFALFPAVQQYAQEGRAYALVTAGAALATRLLVAALERPAPRWRWVAYALTVLAGALLNWFSLLVLPAHALSVALVRPGRTPVRRWAVSAAAAVGGALPLIAASRAQSFQVSWIRPLTWPTVLAIGLLIAVGCLCARVSHRRAGRISPVSIALPLLAVPQLALVLASLVQPVYLVRYVLYTQIGLALLLGLAACRAIRAVTSRRRTARPRLLLTTATGLAFTALLPVELHLRTPHSRVDDVLAAADQVARVARPSDAVLFIPAARRDTALVSPSKFTGLRDVALIESPGRSGTLKGEEGSPREIRASLRAVRRVVVVSDAARIAGRSLDPVRERTKLSVLREEFRIVSDVTVNGRRVAVYERADAR
ncbi:glycosyltransferase family 39 protein [Streptomyces olivoreticuli]|uniref:glycosyltransferase family 39 protein n=1 Tax=Streptomyces olivoreticuli TaxID=68246 RepID=UPI001F0750BF|nr:glycosyltransferase family 39 protein [Streptomyces olivoreticuli]